MLLGCTLIKSDNSKSFPTQGESLTTLLAEKTTPFNQSSLSGTTSRKELLEKDVLQENSNKQHQAVNKNPISIDHSNEEQKHEIVEASKIEASNTIEKNEKIKERDLSSELESNSERAWEQFLSKMIPNKFINDLTLFEKNPFNSDKIEALQRSTKPVYYYLEIESFRSISLDKKVVSNDQKFVDYKSTSESPSYRESIGINLLTDYKFLTLGIGIHYNRFYEQVNYLYDNEITTYESTYDTNYRIINGNFNSNGNPVTLIEEDINETINEKKVEERKELLVRNEFTRIQIPVIVGFQKTYGRILAGVQASFVTNFLNENSGLYVNQDLTGFNSFNEDSQFKELMFSQKNQVNLGFALNEFMLIGGRFSYEYDINSYTNEYDSRFQSYNLGIWLQWRP